MGPISNTMRICQELLFFFFFTFQHLKVILSALAVMCSKFTEGIVCQPCAHFSDRKLYSRGPVLLPQAWFPQGPNETFLKI